jgi:hypothetical protein
VVGVALAVVVDDSLEQPQELPALVGRQRPEQRGLRFLHA